MDHFSALSFYTAFSYSYNNEKKPSTHFLRWVQITQNIHTSKFGYIIPQSYMIRQSINPNEKFPNSVGPLF